MISRYSSIGASDSLGRATPKPSATTPPWRSPRKRHWSPTVFVAALLAISVSRLAAQTPHLISGPNSPLPTVKNPCSVVAGDFNNDGKLDIVVAGANDDQMATLAGDGKGGFTFAWSALVSDVHPKSSLAVGDFDRDGQPDFLVGHQNIGPVLFLGWRSLGGIAASFPGASRGGSDSLAAADFNRDGMLDFVSAGKTGVSVVLGDGTGGMHGGKFSESFSHALPYAGRESVAVEDFNGDGKPDIAVNTPSGVTILLGEGTGKFTAPAGPFAGVGRDSGNLAVGDFNADGKPDLVSASSLGITMLLNDGTGKFAAAPDSPFAAAVGSPNGTVAVADFSADGVPDLVVANTVSQEVTILVGDGTGQFATTESSPSGAMLPSSIAAGDFNGDGLPDLAIADMRSYTTTTVAQVVVLTKQNVLTANPRSLTVYARAGHAAQSAIPVAVTSPASGAAYTATSNQNWLKPNSVSGITGSTAGVMLRPEALQANQTAMAAGTHTGTVRFAKSDLFGSSVNVTFKVANPAGTLRAISSALVGENPTSAALADFNADGKQDLAVANWSSNSITLLLGDGAGGHTSASTRTVGRHPSSVAAGDFNGDRKQDVSVTNSDDNNVTVLLGDGTGNFPAALGPFPAGCGPASVAVGDFNTDGKPDLAVQEAARSGSATPVVLIADGVGRFTSRSNAVCSQSTAPGRASVAVGDFNGDGKQDLASVSTISGSVIVLLGDGMGNFPSVPNPPVAGSKPGLVVVEDFNGDGKQDLAVGDTGGGVMLLQGDGTGTFTPASAGSFLTGFAIQSMVVGDFDGDGRPDLAVQNTSNGVTVLLGDGTGNFMTPSGGDWFAAGPVSSTFPGSMTVGDFNGDGMPDLAVPANSSNNVLMLLGNPAVTTSTLSTTANATIAPGTAVPLSLTVSNPEPSFTMPFGAVTFYDGARPLGTLTQTTNTYSFNAVNLAPGTHTLSAKYAGNERSVGSTSNTITIQVESTPPAGGAIASGSGAASPFSSPGLAQGQKLISANRTYEARMQSDGNFVIYAAGGAIWSTQTPGRERAPYRLAMQPDGNLVIYGSSDKDVSLGGFGVCRAGSACIATWSTGPRGGSAPYTLTMQDDGNLVMHDSTSRAVWFTGTQR